MTRPEPADMVIMAGTDDPGVPATAAEDAQDHALKAMMASGDVRRDRCSCRAASGDMEAAMLQDDMRRPG